VVGAAAWNLAELVEARREEGLEGVAARLAGAPGTGPAVGDGSAAGDGSAPGDGRGPARGRLAGSDGLPAPAGSAAPDRMDEHRSRTIRMPTGYEMHPWADLRPAGQEPAQTRSQVRKLWHQSPGSAG
jgi:error-prone DNA polymerase